ncbi:MAG: DUF5710 domain-containing protein [Candidatus Dactylopiibacterium sp.]|nr:DUF5710 domain-containing protein [Candidatus Dactylopiibacterium sp.]
MRVDLRVPFAEKDEAKRLGARWDASRKVWYVQNVANLATFQRWLTGAPAEPAPAKGRAAPSAPRPSPTNLIAGQSVTGAGYVALACDCLPWVGCPSCQATLQANGWAARIRP